MATIVSTLFISLDGVAEIGADWHFPYFDENMGRAVSEDYEGADTLLLGRVTYDSFAGAWPEREAAGGADAGFAASLGDRRKIVVSRQPLEFTWRNSELVDGDLLDAVAALRADDTLGRVLVAGSISVVRQLLAAGLLDELRLLVHPVAARAGKRLFDEGDERRHLRLLSSEVLPTGVVRLRYAPSSAPGAADYDDVAAVGPEARA
ncbi:dihydrofolate reductase family protein [Pseudonocardia sp.]|jgi:dihydrofolate reductase|uniref:dihydrofolate reductase family protein n=1 Tax=Pseudonocardia sp. TaxID=60912 RepID=UPI003D0ABDC1